MSLKVSLMKGVTQFGKKNKLVPRHIGPFFITNHIGDIAYYWSCQKVCGEYT